MELNLLRSYLLQLITPVAEAETEEESLNFSFCF